MSCLFDSIKKTSHSHTTRSHKTVDNFLGENCILVRQNYLRLSVQIVFANPNYYLCTNELGAMSKWKWEKWVCRVTFANEVWLARCQIAYEFQWFLFKHYIWVKICPYFKVLWLKWSNTHSDLKCVFVTHVMHTWYRYRYCKQIFI